MKRSVFISYSHKDQHLVLPIIELFTKLKINFWWDQMSIKGGDDWRKKIHRGVRGATIFMPIITPNYRNSRYCKIEYETADMNEVPFLAIYKDEVLTSILDTYSTRMSNQCFMALDRDEAWLLNALEKSDLLLSCSVFNQTDSIDLNDYHDYTDDAHTYLRSETKTHEKIKVFYWFFWTWYKLIAESKTVKNVDLKSFIVREHRTIPNRIFIEYDKKNEQKIEAIDVKGIICESQSIIKKYMQHHEEVVDKIDLIITNELNRMVHATYHHYHDFFDDLEALYHFYLFINHDTQYQMNQHIIQYQTNLFYQAYMTIKPILSHPIDRDLLGDIISQKQQRFDNVETSALEKVLDTFPNSNIYLFGEGGSGKTTQILQYAFHKQDETPFIYIPLELLNRSKSSIIEHVLKSNLQLGYNFDYNKLIDYAKRKPVVLLLDGANEIHDNAKSHVIAEIKALSQTFKVIITARSRDINPFYSIEKDNELDGFTYLEYLPLNKEQVLNVLEKNQIDFNIEKDAVLLDTLKNNLRLNIFLSMIKHNPHADRKMLTSPGKLLHAYFFDRNEHSIYSRLLHDLVVSRGSELRSYYEKMIETMFDEIETGIIHHTDFNQVFKDDLVKQLLPKLSILEQIGGKWRFTYQMYHDFFMAHYLSKELKKWVFAVKDNKDFDSSNIRALLKTKIPYQTLLYAANLCDLPDNIAMIEQIFKYFYEHPTLMDEKVILNLYLMSQFGINDCNIVVNYYGLIKTIPMLFLSECHIMQSLYIPEGVTEISRSAFFECRNLEEISLPKSLKIIRAWAFIRCGKLRGVELLQNVESLNQPTFIDCGGMIFIKIDPRNKWFKTDNHYQSIIDIKKKKLLLVVQGFEGEMVISEGVLEIGNWSFKDCKKISAIVIPKSVKKISGDAFDNCYQNQGFYVDHANPYFESDQGILLQKKQKKDKDKKALLRLYGAFNGTLKIADNIDEILADSISTCTHIKEIHIHANVHHIGNYAFADCPRLERVIFNNLSQLSAVDKYIFLSNDLQLVIEDQSEKKEYKVPAFLNRVGRIIKQESSVIKSQQSHKPKKLEWHKIFKKLDFDYIHQCFNVKSVFSLAYIRDLDVIHDQKANPFVILFGLKMYEGISALTPEERSKMVLSWVKNEQLRAVLIFRDLPLLDEIRTVLVDHDIDVIRFYQGMTSVLRYLENYME